jgi:hypothetical protein
MTAEIFNVKSAGQHMFTPNIHEAAGPFRRSYSTHLPDTEPAP